jgi:dienelactone hydrolase
MRSTRGGFSHTSELAVRIPAQSVVLDADLVPPSSGHGCVIFAHGSGSGRKSPRNRQVAATLQEAGLGTLLLDLLDAREARRDELTAEYRFNIPLLTERLLSATDWILRRPETKGLRLGYFGASTGGAVAMRAAALRSEAVGAIVLRGARTDLGDVAAGGLRCPTLILVGGNDPEIERLNRVTLDKLRCEKRLTVIPRASHLFEEPGALEAVARETVGWFLRYLVPLTT